MENRRGYMKNDKEKGNEYACNSYRRGAVKKPLRGVTSEPSSKRETNRSPLFADTQVIADNESYLCFDSKERNKILDFPALAS